MKFRISVDSGGTFTDGVLMDAGGLATMRKAHTTPHDPTVGTLDCMSRLAASRELALADLLGATDVIVLGTTMATNAVATRSGPRLGTIASKGYRLRMAFPQVAKIEWKEGPLDMYDFRANPPEPLAAYHLMTEVEERLDFRGQVLTPLNEEDCRKAARYLRDQGVETVAIMLLHSHLNPKHERRVAEIVRQEAPGMQVTLSSTVLPVAGEVERWSTAMFSAYVAPVVRKFVSRIGNLLRENGFRGQLQFMQSNGGLAAPDVVAENPAVLLLSGPAAGPSLGRTLGAEHDYPNILSVDMGGTSFDVGVVHEGVVETVRQQVIDGKKFALPSVDVSAVGAGGGSIAHVDAAGRLQVGPKSAGATPGPACYGKGGVNPTVTDANVVLGYIDPGFFLGGETKLRKDLAEQAIEAKVARPLGLTVLQAAAAIHEVINSNMASGTHVAFAQRGYDPRDFALCAAGGGAAVHAVRLMQELHIGKLIVPKVAPTYCAFGMMFCDFKHDYQRAYYSETANADLDRLMALFEEMEAEARATLATEGAKPGEISIKRTLDVRYYGQFRDRNAPLAGGKITRETLKSAIARFHAIHEQTVGYGDPTYPTEIMRLHVSATAAVGKPHLLARPRGTDIAAARKGHRKAWFAESSDYVDTPVYDGEKLLSGAQVQGPAIIEEVFTTFVLPPGVSTKVDDHGNFVTTVAATGV